MQPFADISRIESNKYFDTYRCVNIDRPCTKLPIHVQQISMINKEHIQFNIYDYIFLNVIVGPVTEIPIFSTPNYIVKIRDEYDYGYIAKIDMNTTELVCSSDSLFCLPECVKSLTIESANVNIMLPVLPKLNTLKCKLTNCIILVPYSPKLRTIKANKLSDLSFNTMQTIKHLILDESADISICTPVNNALKKITLINMNVADLNIVNFPLLKKLVIKSFAFTQEKTNVTIRYDYCNKKIKLSCNYNKNDAIINIIEGISSLYVKHPEQVACSINPEITKLIFPANNNAIIDMCTKYKSSLLMRMLAIQGNLEKYYKIIYAQLVINNITPINYWFHILNPEIFLDFKH